MKDVIKLEFLKSVIQFLENRFIVSSPNYINQQMRPI